VVAEIPVREPIHEDGRARLDQLAGAELRDAALAQIRIAAIERVEGRDRNVRGPSNVALPGLTKSAWNLQTCRTSAGLPSRKVT
jgi:hypothetical protein